MPEGGEANRIIDGLEENRCPIRDCGVKVRRGQFMCAPHWREVPDLLKRELRDAVRGPWKPWLESAVAVIRSVEGA